RLRSLSGPVRHGGVVQVSDRSQPHTDLSQVPLAGHAGRTAADGSALPVPRELVPDGRARGVAVVIALALGRTDQDRHITAAPARGTPDAADVRRPGAPQPAA